MPSRIYAVFAPALLAFLLVLPCPAPAGEKADTIIGIRLGDDIAGYTARADLENAMALWDRPWVKRAELTPVEGYKSGYVSYGTCVRPGRIMRIKLKYKDNSADFFNRLKETLTKRFGKHDDWRGNPFGTLKIWKWAVGEEPANVSVILQRYEGDDDNFTRGNSIRISVPEWEREEMRCYQDKEAKTKPKEALASTKSGLAWYLPY